MVIIVIFMDIWLVDDYSLKNFIQNLPYKCTKNIYII